MKHTLKHIGASALLFLYSLLIVIQPLHASAKVYEKTDRQVAISKNCKKDVALHQIVRDSGKNLHQSNFRVIYPVFTDLFPEYVTAKIHLKANYKQYSFYSNKIIERFSSTDIIFPFHYFL